MQEEEKMNEKSLLYDLLLSVNCFAKYLGINPGIYSFNENEIMISFPGSVFNPTQLLEDLENPMVFVVNNFEGMFSGYDDDKKYIDMLINPNDSIWGATMDFRPECGKGVLLTDFMIRLFFRDSGERDVISSMLENINFLYASCFVIENNEFTKKHLTSDLEGTNLIFMKIDEDDDPSRIKENMVRDMSISQMKGLFDRYFRTKQDSLEFYYIFENSSFCSSLLIALRQSMKDNDIRLLDNADGIEFYSEDSRIRFSYDTDAYAEKVMLALLFGNSQRKGIPRL